MCRNQAAYRIILGWCKLNTYGGHGGTHVIGVSHAPVHDFAAGDMGDIGAGTVIGQNGAAGGGGGPLGGGSPLAAIGHRHPVLPLGGAEVGAGKGGGPAGKAAVDEQRRQGQGFSHGGAGAVEAVEGDAKVPEPKGGTNALVQQVSGQDIIQIGGFQPGPVQRPLKNFLLHGGLAFFPGLFPEKGIIGKFVEISGQRAVSLLPSADVGKGQDRGRMGQGDGAFADTFFVHEDTSIL